MMKIEVDCLYEMHCVEEREVSGNSENPNRTLHKVTWSKVDGSHSVSLFKRAQSLESSRELLTEHFRTTLSSVKVIVVNDNMIPKLKILFWNFKRPLSRLSVLPGNENDLLEEEIKFTNEKLTVVNMFYIHTPVVDSYRFSRGFRSKTVLVDDANWVDFDAILNSTSHQITLRRMRQVSASQLNTLIKLWMSKEKLKDLERATLVWTSQVNDEDFLTNVFDGIICERTRQNGTVRRVDGKIGRFMVSSGYLQIFISSN